MNGFWVVLAFIAAGAQLGRNLGQRNLVKGADALSRDTANAARYWVGLPLALLAFGALGLRVGWPVVDGRTLFFACLGGLFQIIATDMLIRLFQRRAFGIGVAYQKTENLLMALVGPLGIAGFLGLSVANDILSPLDWAGLILATVGIIIQSVLKLDAKARAFDGMSLFIGLICGLGFMVTGIGLSEAVRSVGIRHDTLGGAVMAGTTVLVITLTFQAILMALWTQIKHPAEWQKLSTRAGSILQIGVYSVIASMALFTAFGLAHPALVSTVKQVDMLLSLAVAYLLYREIPGRWEWVGMVLIFASVFLIIYG